MYENKNVFGGDTALKQTYEMTILNGYPQTENKQE